MFRIQSEGEMLICHDKLAFRKAATAMAKAIRLNLLKFPIGEETTTPEFAELEARRQALDLEIKTLLVALLMTPIDIMTREGRKPATVPAGLEPKHIVTSLINSVTSKGNQDVVIMVTYEIDEVPTEVTIRLESKQHFVVDDPKVIGLRWDDFSDTVGILDAITGAQKDFDRSLDVMLEEDKNHVKKD